VLTVADFGGRFLLKKHGYKHYSYLALLLRGATKHEESEY